MRVECSVEETQLENDKGRLIDGVVVTCGASEQSFGTSERSVTRCLMLLKENCEESDGKLNYYVAEGD